MLETIVMDRGEGKTTKAIKSMEEDNELLLIIPYLSMIKLYPNHLHNRIFSVDNLLNGSLRGRKLEKVILDEGFAQNKEKLAHLYYLLGYERINVTSFGTLWWPNKYI